MQPGLRRRQDGDAVAAEPDVARGVRRATLDLANQ